MSGIDRSISRFDALTNSVKELTKAEIELAKQHAIANGMDAATANAAAADLFDQVDYEAERARLKKIVELEQKRIDAAKDAASKTAEYVKKATDEKNAAEADYQKKRDKYVRKNAAQEGDVRIIGASVTGAVMTRTVTAEEAAASRRDAAMDFEDSGEAAKARERIRNAQDVLDGIKTDEKALAAADDSRAKIEQTQKAIDTLDTKFATRELAVQNELAANAADTARKTADETRAAEVKAAQDAARERDRLDRELHQKRMADLREELAAQSELNRARQVRFNSRAHEGRDGGYCIILLYWNARALFRELTGTRRPVRH